MRIVGGRWAGRDLTSPGASTRVRPTAEHVRTAIMREVAPALTGARVLDLFAGTGAMGLEALSRGARSVDFVENGPPSFHALKANVAALRATPTVRIFKRDALQHVALLPARSYDLAFADPPYASRQLDRLIDRWRRVPFTPMLVVEHAHTHVLPGATRVLRFDETDVSIFVALAAEHDASAVRTD